MERRPLREVFVILIRANDNLHSKGAFHMSYGIIRIQKMTAGSVRGIQIHDRREKEGISHTNKDIDWARTKNNYDLCPAQNKNFGKAVRDRIGQLDLKKAVRKDAVVMAQALVTSDSFFFQSMDKGQQQKFFKECYEFLKNQYGEKNIISATVHLDERTPHMHFNFVPVTEDNRLCAKDIFTPKTLTQLQEGFYNELGKKYGLSRGQQGSKTIHLETAELKRITLEKDIDQLQSRLEQLKSLSLTKQQLDAIMPQKTITGAVSGVTTEQVEMLKKAALAYSSVAKKLQTVTAELEEMKKASQGILQTKTKSIRLERKAERLASNLTFANNQLKVIEESLKDNPEIKEMILERLASQQPNTEKKRGQEWKE